jgi:translocation and assembly module TamA
MLRVVRLRAPAWWPAFLFAAALFLSGCSLLPQKDAAESDATPSAVTSEGGSTGTAFTVDVQAEPAAVREFLAFASSTTSARSRSRG